MSINYIVEEGALGIEVRQRVAAWLLPGLVDMSNHDLYNATVEVSRIEAEIVMITITGLIPVEDKNEERDTLPY